ncbi:hypothetical protein PF001_g9114 [Phytophthora fragariae]|uniref:Uncharacterized protein n=1 Tax=Phytophthora fragariae TaxID=53985 RepID=A0A6A3EMM4_9STRA|nr:hypothetical protein PF009_g15319 [Phytophthora fragariae]KAE9146007.1 hypothetical protein PF006_g9190 [Phytophthora fragariae]KAE9312671.1 hypothetical protein PF001_g9114 [Phytophthora fragariae]KAE9335709.1 hypothetical protein PF008_g13360 [Phytophthora fragariae]
MSMEKPAVVYSPEQTFYEGRKLHSSTVAGSKANIGGNVSVAADVAKGLCRSDSVPADRPRAHDINTLEMTTDSPLL